MGEQTRTPADSEWIEWKGGECPVDRLTLVDVRWNNQAESKAAPAGTWSTQGQHSPTDFWQHAPHLDNRTNSYIIAYRVVRSA